MTGEERKRVLRLIFQELRADHGDDGRLVVKFKPRPEWESYIDAVLAKIAAGTASGTLAAIATSERETGLKAPDVETMRLARDERGWLRLAS
jgi:hypothetical protein